MAASAPPPPKVRPLDGSRPMPISSGQEQEIKALYYKRVRAMCADEIREFATCARNHTIAVNFSCRDQKLAMNSCMVQHATQDERDRAREEWFATREQRKKERDVLEEKKKQQEKFHREWWGLDEQGRRDFTKQGRILPDPGSTGKDI